ncbi:hypothetical protein SELMODRAFT_89604 [Selaginella moellendorffii]|uniref:F-box domain-containing protein n=1 Tax=Selaginella moellendorffii TaxID=88036 RepID=D8RAG1_SELML|nr:hypothetical protein SELMODRAFT_89604 [Selaginella moellendorffii]
MKISRRWIHADDDPDSINSRLPDDLLKIIFSRLGDDQDHASVARVCRQWRDAESATREKITVNFSYAVSPGYVIDRFGQLRALKIKGKPRASDFGLIPVDWGGYGGPWIAALALARARSLFGALASLHFKRMEISDEDLALLAETFRDALQVLKLEKCSGFTSLGLESIARSCRDLRVLSLDESDIEDKGSQWLRELIHSCASLEALNLSMTGLELRDIRLVEEIVSSSKLKSLKLNDLEDPSRNRRLDLRQSSLQELGFCGLIQVSLPSSLSSFSGDLQLAMEPNLASALTSLDLLYTTANHEQHLEIIKGCRNLQVFKANIIGDIGLELLASHCKGLQRIRIENMRQQEQHGFSISNSGMLALAKSCVHLQSFSMYVHDAANSSLEALAESCPGLLDFRLGILETAPDMAEPLDAGVQSLLQRCPSITKLALYLKEGGLTDRGLESIGRLGQQLKWILLGCLSDSDTSDRGLVSLARGCSNLRKLEVRNCPFSDAAIVCGIRGLPLLRYLWFQCYHRVSDRHFALLEPEWRIELMPEFYSVLCYRALVSGSRGDHPPSVRPMLGGGAGGG